MGVLTTKIHLILDSFLFYLLCIVLVCRWVYDAHYALLFCIGFYLVTVFLCSGLNHVPLFVIKTKEFDTNKV